MDEAIKFIKRLGIPMIVIVLFYLILSSYKDYLQITFYNLSIAKLKKDILEGTRTYTPPNPNA